MKKINLNIDHITNMKYSNYNRRNRYELTDENISQSLQYQPSTTVNNNSHFFSKIAKECLDINSIVKNSVEKINTLFSNKDIKAKTRKYTHHKYSNSIDNHKDSIFEKLNEEEDSKRTCGDKEVKKIPNIYKSDIKNETTKTIYRGNINNIFNGIKFLNVPSKNKNKNENILCKSSCLNDVLLETENDEALLNLESNKLYKNKNEKTKKIVNKTIIASPLKKTKKIKDAVLLNKYSKKSSENITQANKKSSQIKAKRKNLYEKYIRDDNTIKKKVKNYHGSLTKELNSEKKDKYMNNFFGNNNNNLKKKIVNEKEILSSKMKQNKGFNNNKKSVSTSKRNQNIMNSLINSTIMQDYSTSNIKKLFGDENSINNSNFKLKENREKIKVLDYLKMNFILTEYLINNNLFEDLNNNKNLINEYSLFIANKIKIGDKKDKKEIKEEDSIRKIQRIWRQHQIKNYTKNENEGLKKMVYNNFLMKSGYKIRKLLEIFHNLIANFKECHNNYGEIDEIFVKLKKIINRDLTANEKNILYKEYINTVIYCK